MEKKNKLPEASASDAHDKTNSDAAAATGTSQPEPKAQKTQGEQKGEKEKKSFLKSLSSMTLSDLFKKKKKEESVVPKKNPHSPLFCNPSIILAWESRLICMSKVFRQC